MIGYRRYSGVLPCTVREDRNISLPKHWHPGRYRGAIARVDDNIGLRTYGLLGGARPALGSRLRVEWASHLDLPPIDATARVNLRNGGERTSVAWAYGRRERPGKIANQRERKVRLTSSSAICGTGVRVR